MQKKLPIDIEYFGFTDSHVAEMLEYYGLSDHKDLETRKKCKKPRPGSLPAKARFSFYLSVFSRSSLSRLLDGLINLAGN